MNLDRSKQRDITFTAADYLIDAASERAARQGSSLDLQFALWLRQYAAPVLADRAISAVRDLQEHVNTAGRKFTRDEMNER
jgi:hypothetical protein